MLTCLLFKAWSLIKSKTEKARNGGVGDLFWQLKKSGKSFSSRWADENLHIELINNLLIINF